MKKEHLKYVFSKRTIIERIPRFNSTNYSTIEGPCPPPFYELSPSTLHLIHPIPPSYSSIHKTYLITSNPKQHKSFIGYVARCEPLAIGRWLMFARMKMETLKEREREREVCHGRHLKYMSGSLERSIIFDLLRKLQFLFSYLGLYFINFNKQVIVIFLLIHFFVFINYMIR